MAESDRIKWDQRYRQFTGIGQEPPSWLLDVSDEIPHLGRALDIAAGTGRLSLWLARRGLDVLAVDISSVGLELAQQTAEAEGHLIETLALDLEAQSLPDGPFDVITCFHYWQRDIFPMIRDRLRPEGVFVAEVSTIANLELHPHPSLQYLAEPNELKQQCRTLQIAYYQECWSDDNAMARVVARK